MTWKGGSYMKLRKVCWCYVMHFGKVVMRSNQLDFVSCKLLKLYWDFIATLTIPMYENNGMETLNKEQWNEASYLVYKQQTALFKWIKSSKVSHETKFRKNKSLVNINNHCWWFMSSLWRFFASNRHVCLRFSGRDTMKCHLSFLINQLENWLCLFSFWKIKN